MSYVRSNGLRIRCPLTVLVTELIFVQEQLEKREGIHNADDIMRTGDCARASSDEEKQPGTRAMMARFPSLTYNADHEAAATNKERKHVLS